MKTSNRRDFLKKAALAGASALVAPGLLATEEKEVISFSSSPGGETDKFIIPKNNGLKITGTFLDEISHDIPHQNWSEREWEQDFRYMKSIGIDTVIMIRSGYRKFITYPSKYLLGKGCYMPSFDLAVDISDTHHDSSREQGLERFKHLFRGLLFKIDVPVGIRKASVSFGLCDIARAFAGGNDDSIRNLREKIANKLLCSVNSVSLFFFLVQCFFIQTYHNG